MLARYRDRFVGFSPTVVRYLFATALIGFAVDGGVYSVLLNLYLVRLGYGPEQIGLVNSVGTLVFALLSLPAGVLGERFGTRQLLLIGLALMLVGGTLFPLADLLPVAFQLGWLLTTIVLLYCGLALFFVNTAPYLMAVIDAAQRNRAFSVQTALMSLAAFIGSLIGGFLPPLFTLLLGTSPDDPTGYRYGLIVAGLAMLPGILAIRAGEERRTRPIETPVAPAEGPMRLVGPVLGLMALIAGLRVLQVSGTAVANTFFNVYLDSELALPSAQIGAIIAAARLLGVPAALAMTGLTARFGNRNVVIGASIGTALSLLPLALIPHWAAAGIGFIGVVGLSWIRYTSSLVFYLELVPPAQRATLSGVTEMAAGICFTLLTFGGGYMIALLGYQALFLSGAALTLLSALLFWYCFRSAR